MSVSLASLENATNRGRKMALSTLILLLQETPAPNTGGTQNTIRIVTGVLALLLVVIIIMRRRSGKKKDEEEF